jgi:hypothetical protein
MSIVLAVGVVAALVNLWAFVDTWRHPRRQWRNSPGSRTMWAMLTLAGFACGASTAPMLAPIAVYIAFAYAAAAHPFLEEDVRAA